MLDQVKTILLLLNLIRLKTSMQTRRLCKSSQTLKLDVGGISATIFVRACLAQKILMKSELHLFPCFLSGLCCLLPLCLRITSNLEDRPLRDSLGYNPPYRYSCVAAVAIVIPLLLDTIFDLASSTTSPSSKDNKKLNSNDSKTARFNFMNVHERVRVF